MPKFLARMRGGAITASPAEVATYSRAKRNGLRILFESRVVDASWFGSIRRRAKWRDCFEMTGAQSGSFKSLSDFSPLSSERDMAARLFGLFSTVGAI